MTRTHGSLRGMKHVNRSSIGEARFGRMFRSLYGETYDRTDLAKLAKAVIQRETAHFRGPGEEGKDPAAKVNEGPDVVFDTPKAGKLLDTAYKTPEPADENPAIPAGYTYFGQFIDHDLTFDPNSSLQKHNDPDATVDFRTPRLDLDSLYGRGPDDQPYLYQDSPEAGGGIRFLLGRSLDDPKIVRPGELPRNVEGRSLTGDPRNDENGIIGQLQVVFLQFHNKVVDAIKFQEPLLDNHSVFSRAQRIVRWHYQYLVLNDYLRRVVGDKTWTEVFNGSGGIHPDPNVRFYTPKNDQAYMPVEFSVAAFRFGHSMVRPSYALRADDATVGGDAREPFTGDPRFHRIPIFSDKPRPAPSLDGFGPLPTGWEIDWHLFFADSDMPTAPSADGPLQVEPQALGHLTQPGYRIDTQLVDPLAMLPPNVAKSGNMPDGIPSLAFRNLIRGSEFALPSGQSIANKLRLPILSEDDLWSTFKGDKDAGIPAYQNPKENPFTLRAPLWFYILMEAQRQKKVGLENDTVGGHHLGPVGGRIVAEVLVGIALHDHSSYLAQDPQWTPAREQAKSGFDLRGHAPLTDMFQLIHWTTGGKMKF